MKLSEIKAIKKELEDLNIQDWRTFIEEFDAEESDFIFDGYHFIEVDGLVDLALEKLNSDPRRILNLEYVGKLVQFGRVSRSIHNHIMENAPHLAHDLAEDIMENIKYDDMKYGNFQQWLSLNDAIDIIADGVEEHEIRLLGKIYYVFGAI